MEWLLAGGTAGGVVGVVVLAIFVYKMARDSRGDQEKLRKTEAELSSTTQNLEAHRRAVVELENGLDRAENALAREEQSRRIAEIAMERTRRTLAKNLSAAGVVADLRDTLDRLSKMSAMSRAAASTDRKTSRVLHGSAPDGPDGSGKTDRDSGSGQT